MTATSRSTTRDGGYGWVIVLAFFCTQFLVDGMRFSFGLMFVELLGEYHEGKGSTAWVGSIAIGVYNMFGPVYGIIVTKFGCRTSIMMGGVVSAAGFVASFFSTELYHLYFTYGLMQGVGFGLTFLAGTVSVGQYFLLKRAFAIGLAYCGSGFGMFAFTPLVRAVIDAYTWRGAVLILAGLALNCAVFGALHRPFINNTEEEWYELEESKAMLPDAQRYCMSRGNSTEIHVYKEADVDNSNIVVPENRRKGEPADISKEASLNDNGSMNLTTSQVAKTDRTTDVPRTFSDMRNEQFASGKWTSNSILHSHRSVNLSVLSHSLFGSNASFGSNVDIHAKPNLRASSALGASSGHDGNHLSSTDKGIHFPVAFIEKMFPKRLITNINFVILFISMFLHGICSFVPFAILPDYCLKVGGCSKSQSAWLLSAMGIGGILGRIGAGWITDRPGVHKLSFLTACHLICGLSNCLTAVLTTFELLMLNAAVFGVFFGASYIIPPIVLLEYFGEEFIAQIMGIIMLIYGVSNLFGSPIAGWLFDGTGDYRYSFLFAGGTFILTAVTTPLVLCTKPSREARRQKKNKEIEQNGHS